MESFGFCLFVGDLMIWVGLDILGQGYQALGCNRKR